MERSLDFRFEPMDHRRGDSDITAVERQGAVFVIGREGTEDDLEKGKELDSPVEGAETAGTSADASEESLVLPRAQGGVV